MSELNPIPQETQPETLLFRGDQLYKAPQPKPTTSDGTLANAVIRIGEIETALRNLNLIK